MSVQGCQWPGPCCRTGEIPERTRLDAADVYLHLGTGDGTLSPYTMLWAHAPVAVARGTVVPLARAWASLLTCRGHRERAHAWHAWADSLAFLCPFVEHHARQSVGWTLACALAAILALALGLWSGWLLVGGYVAIAALVALVGGHVSAAARAEAGGWEGPPLVHHLLRDPLAQWRGKA